jgi:hypothetical protein
MSKYTEAQRAFIDKARAYALENYEQGGDIIYECYEDHEILALENLDVVRERWETYDEHRREIQSTAW